MPKPDQEIKVLGHFPGLPDVSGHGERPIHRQAVPEPETELEFPPAMIAAVREAEPGEPVVIKYDRKSKRPLVLASHGRKVNLAHKQELVEAAMDAGKTVEVHVFDDPPKGR